jgi:lauroyl/myristoyl acyltransferase
VCERLPLATADLRYVLPVTELKTREQLSSQTWQTLAQKDEYCLIAEFDKLSKEQQARLVQYQCDHAETGVRVTVAYEPDIQERENWVVEQVPLTGFTVSYDNVRAVTGWSQQVLDAWTLNCELENEIKLSPKDYYAAYQKLKPKPAVTRGFSGRR